MMRPLVVDRRAVAEARVPTMRVVPALDPFEDGHAGFRLALEPPTIQQLALQRREEALSHRIVVGVADRAHRRHDAGFLAALAEGVTGVLRPAVRMMNDAAGPALTHRHLQGIQ